MLGANKSGCGTSNSFNCPSISRTLFSIVPGLLATANGLPLHTKHGWVLTPAVTPTSVFGWRPLF